MPPAPPTDRVPSGLGALDGAWGGLCRGDAHLLYGRAATARDVVALRLVRGALDAGETCVLVSARRPHDLAEPGRLAGLDVEAAARGGQLRLLHLPPDLADSGDARLTAALTDLGRIAAEAAPDRLVVEDFTPFVRFREFGRLRAAVLAFLEALRSGGITAVLTLGEPANAHSREIVAFMRAQAAVALHVAEDPAQPGAPPPPHPPPPPGPRRGRPRGGLGRPAPPPAEPPSSEDSPPHDLVVSHTPPSDEAPISFFDLHDPFGPAPQVEDPFAREEGAFDSSRFVAGEAPSPPPPPPSADDDWAEPLLRNAFYLGEDAPPDSSNAPPLPPWEEVAALEGPTEREAFADAFDAALRRRDAGGAPFLALALRIVPPDDEHADTIAWAVREAAGADGTALADAARGRLALLLPGLGADDAQGAFRRLRQLLRESGATGAEARLRAASALVVPGGRPFQSGEAFLAYAVDAD